MLVILLTVCHTVHVMLVWRIWYWINLQSHNWYFSLFSSLVCLVIVLILKGEILSWLLTGVKGLNIADQLGRTFVGMPAKFVPDVLQNSSVIRIATLRGWPDHKKIIFCIVLPMNSLQVYFDLRYNCSCLRWVSLLFLRQIIVHVI